MTRHHQPISRYVTLGLTYAAPVFILTAFGILTTEEVWTTLETLGFVLGFPLGIALLIASIFYYYEQVYSPKKAMKMLRHSSIAKFKDYGFVQSEDFFHGTIDGFECQVWWSPYSPVNGNRSSINTLIFFEPPKFQLEEVIERNKRKKWFWGPNGVFVYHEILFRNPKHEKLKSDLDDLIDTLIKNHLEPEKKESTSLNPVHPSVPRR